jgi:hypothetical protein
VARKGGESLNCTKNLQQNMRFDLEKLNKEKGTLNVKFKLARK